VRKRAEVLPNAALKAGVRSPEKKQLGEGKRIREPSLVRLSSFGVKVQVGIIGKRKEELPVFAGRMQNCVQFPLAA